MTDVGPSLSSVAVIDQFDERSGIVGSRRRAVVAIVAFVALWASLESVGSMVFRSITLWQVVFVRYTIHLAIVLALWGRKSPWRTRRLRYQLGRSALMIVMPGAFVLGATRGVALAWINTIFWSAPLLVLAFAALIDRERAAMATWAAAALGMVAAWLYFAPTGAPTRGAIGFGLAMASSFALYIPMTRRLREEPLRTNLFYTGIVPLVVLLPLMPRVWVAPAFSEFLGLAFIGAAGWIALLALDRAADAAPVSLTAPLLHLQVGFIMAFSFVAHAYPSPRRFAAAAAVLIGAAALAWPALRREQTDVVVGALQVND